MNWYFNEIYLTIKIVFNAIIKKSTHIKNIYSPIKKSNHDRSN